jgi:competence ComEA-like helix-hairpin-helix protein
VLVYTRREIVLLLIVVVIGAAGVATDRWRREHPDVAARLETLDRAAPSPPSPAPAQALSARVARPTTAPATPPAHAVHVPRRADIVTPVDLNLASREDLQSLPGVGPALAARIVDARARDGPFASVEDLRRVRGVGRATLERLRPLLAVNTP